MAAEPMQDNALLCGYGYAGDDAHETAIPAGFGAPAAFREDWPCEGAAEEAGYQRALLDSSFSSRISSVNIYRADTNREPHERQLREFRLAPTRR